MAFDSCSCSCSLREGGTSFRVGCIPRKLKGFIYVSTVFTLYNVLLPFTLWITIFFLCSQFLTLFHVIYSLNRLLFLSLETLKSIIRTDQHIVLELVNLFCVNGLAKMLNFPTRIHNSDSPFLALLDLLLFSIF